MARVEEKEENGSRAINFFWLEQGVELKKDTSLLTGDQLWKGSNLAAINKKGVQLS